MAWRHDIQTLNSYARLIWVCTHSPKRSALSNARERGKNTTFQSFCIVWVQNMMTVIADHSCQQLTTVMHVMLQLSACAATPGGYTGTCLNEYPACLAFSARQNAKRRLGTPPLQGFAKPPLCRLKPLIPSHTLQERVMANLRPGFRERRQHPATQLYRPARSSTGRSSAHRPRPCTHSPANAPRRP